MDESIADLYQQLLQSRTDQSLQAEALRQKQEELVQRLRSGESLGDPIKDFLILHRMDGPETEQAYRALQQRVIDHAGELIFVINRDENFFGCGGFGYEPRPRDYLLTTSYFIGVLTPEGLIFDPKKGKWAFPVERYFTTNNPFDPQSYQSKPGPLSIWFGEYFFMEQSVRLWTNPEHANLARFEFAIGNAEVERLLVTLFCMNEIHWKMVGGYLFTPEQRGLSFLFHLLLSLRTTFKEMPTLGSYLLQLRMHLLEQLEALHQQLDADLAAIHGSESKEAEAAFKRIRKERDRLAHLFPTREPFSHVGPLGLTDHPLVQKTKQRFGW